MARPEITARISADGSGFRREMNSLGAFAKSWAGNIRSYFLSAFSITAITRLAKAISEYVKDVSEASTKLGISEDAVQRLMEYAKRTGQDFDEIAKDADKIVEALDRASQMEIEAPLTKDDVALVKKTTAQVDEFGSRVKAGLANLWGAAVQIFEAGLTDFETQQMRFQYIREKAAKARGETIPPAESVVPPEPEMTPFQNFWRTVDPKQYFERYGYPGVQYDLDKRFEEGVEALWTEAYNKLAENAAKIHEGWPGIPKKTKTKEWKFEAPTDALANIGGFVGQGTQNRVQHHLQQMNRHLATIERALVSRGIKIQDL